MRIAAVLAAWAILGSGALASTALASGGGGAQHATAVIINADGDEIGTARFVEDGTGVVHVNVKASGLTEGEHGIHIHAIGECTPTAFTSAGGHHNPGGAKHGFDNPDGPHAGDLPVLVANASGNGRLNATTERATLSAGATSIFDGNGSAIVIHALPDDQITDPTGNSGTRVACGVIVAG